MKLISLAFSVFFIVSANAQTPKSVVVLDVQQNANTIFVSPVLIYENGNFNAPYSTLKGETARRRFVEKYFSSGKNYILIFGGGNAGSLKIKEGYWQDGAYAYGELTENEPGRIRGQLHSLATDYDTTARGSAWRRSPTADERAGAIALAKDEYTKHGLPANAIEKIEVMNLTAIDVDGDNKAELVGSFKVPQPNKDKPPHFLFLIIDGEPGNYHAARENYQFNPKQAEYPLGLEMLSDNLDIDGDGINEIVTFFSGPGFKDFYLVYQLKNGTWGQVYSGAGMR
ncbi:MAG: hypothetical protein DMF69_06720 [Acidobacteria bacterium]|nr:MAG: hypothetical protein DMF69_06720 [Acidobacteriota bacterium]